MKVSDQRLTNKSIIVTGGGTGIGHACAALLAREGAHVTICGRTEDSLRKSAASINAALGGAEAVRYRIADALNETDMKEVARLACERTGSIDGCIANAGGGGMPGPTHEQDVAEFTRVLNGNIVATLVTIKSVIEPMRSAGGGSIVLISSLNGDSRVVANYTSAYSAAKAGIDQMMRVAAVEYGKDFIRVNSIRPGYIHTEINDKYVGTGTRFYQSCRDNVPLAGPLGQPDDIASLAGFLLGEQARWITGQAISVDGGQSLHQGPDSSELLASVRASQAG